MIIAIFALGALAGASGLLLGFAAIRFKVEGDPIVAVRAGPQGTLVHGAPACLQVQDSRHGGWDECISFPEDGNAPALHDLPMF